MIRIQEYNPNLTEIAERVLLGPQADILEKINQFNNYYQTNLKCTKMFRWSPGVSQQVKEAYERFILRWDMKYGGVEQFFKRIENRDYTHKNMARMLNDINNRMSGLRREGLSMQDNGDLVAEAFINTKEHILKELKLLEEVIDSSKFLINIYIEENDNLCSIAELEVYPEPAVVFTKSSTGPAVTSLTFATAPDPVLE